MTLTDFLEQAHRQIQRAWSERAASAGVSQSEYEYLRAIKEQESRKTDKNDHGQHLQDVVVAMGVRKASASAMVLKLENRGLVKRIPCQMDARAQHILLTAEGQALLAAGRAVHEAATKALLEDLPEVQRAALKELFKD